MSQQYTQLQGYKHLLQVAENILYSSQIDQQILQKYQQLKESINKKITPYNKTQQLSSSSVTTSQQIDNFYLNLLSTYRLLIDNAVKIVQKFQQQLQDQMQRENYNNVVYELNNNFINKFQQLQTIVDYNTNNSNTSTTNYTKTKLLHKQQLNTLKYQHDQLDSKFQNLGLLIQVHKKMHQIILQATKAEQKKLNIQDKYKDKIKQLQTKLNQVQDVNMFIQQHKLTQNNYAQFITASKTLKKVLFANQFN